MVSFLNVVENVNPKTKFLSLSTTPTRDDRKHSCNNWKIIHSNNARSAGKSAAFGTWWMVSREFKLEGHLRPVGPIILVKIVFD